MRVLETGGTGFIGGHLVAALVARGDQVRCLVRPTSDRTPLAGLDIEYVVGSLHDLHELRRAVRDVDLVFHLAGATKVRRLGDYDRINHGGTQDLLQACMDAGTSLHNVVYISSIAAAGPSLDGRPRTECEPERPVGPYGVSKLRAEQAVLEAGEHLPVTILRPSAIYGPYDTDFFQLFQSVKRGVIPCIGRGELQVDLCFVEDVVRGMIAASACPAASNQVFFLGGACHTWREMGAEIARQLGQRPLTLRLPRALAFAAATGADTWARVSGQVSILSRANLRERLQPFWVVDSARAQRTFGYAPEISLSEGIARTLRWYRETGWL